MSPQDLQDLIRSRIPVADFMQLQVQALQPDRVVIAAPLEPNRNVHGTLFGGSGSAMALVAAWSLVHARVQDQGWDIPLVVARQTTQYFKPVVGAVTAQAVFQDAQGWPDFIRNLSERGRARVPVVVELRQVGHSDVAARTEALFAAVADAAHPR